ncbi:E3 ubiquitin-protein ligase HUWE1 [Phlebotomus argentipes]|uniref:E3 ubiquitin-protein ligase HUWE1 n=1 Tax=Phlebotomus argentipes TaxID=94469 RepID=UPI00289323F5|nr:E3 ubiquitin-protein ligase HUWE1 [Phlebotomus argentipes]
MKIDTSRLKRGNSDVSPECQALIERLRCCSRTELAAELAKIESWTFGKCELYHWIEVLDIFDSILEEATDIQRSEWHIEIDVNFSSDEVKLVLLVLNFTTLLIEHSFSRHLYSSIEHLSALLLSVDMDIVLGVLNLLYMFSKRSNYLSRLTGDTRAALLGRLNFIAESWGGREYGLGLAECCRPDAQLPPSATIFYYEYYNKRGDLETINMEDVRGKFSDPRDLTVHLLQRSTDRLTDEQRIHLFMRLRSSMRFHEHRARLQFVQARLQALSVLVYSDAIHEKTHSLIYPGFLEELVELLELAGGDLVEIHAAALRTMTSIIHLDRNPTLPKKPSSRLGMIIDVTGANSYHGFLPTLVRGCIGSLTAPTETFPLPLATALFSFLYHLATYEVGGESLVACGMMESLLRVINWQGTELEHITFVTRAVRVIDLITNIDMAGFQLHAGLASFIARLEIEVATCRTDQPDEIAGEEATSMQEAAEMPRHRGGVCLPQRAALLKSMLNFLKKAIQDRAFAESIPHVMEGTLPASLRHIISNAEYYGPSLFLLATDVVTVYVFQEPSLLSALQDNGLTDVVLQALLHKDVPATREVLGSLPNVFSALCLNGRGLEAFLAYGPFDRLFRVLLSPTYLPAMRRRRSSIGDTATNLGNAVDELMRHQPRLRQAATAAIVKLLRDLVELGSSARFVCWRPPATVTPRDVPAKKTTPADAGSSDDEEEDEEEASTASQRYDTTTPSASRQQVPLTDYIHNTMKFIDAILSKSNSDDHCREFVNQGGLRPLLQVLALPNLPVDCPVTASAQSVAAVCKSIMSLAFEPMVLGIALEHLSEIVTRLEPLQRRLECPGGSVLLSELAHCPDPELAFATPAFTPLLHAISAAHGYIVMLVHVCRTGQNNVRTVSLQKWGQDSEQGLGLLRRLVQLYTALVWESTLLLALCTDDIIPADCDFGKEDLDRLVRDTPPATDVGVSSGVTNAMENLTTRTETVMEIDLTQSSTESEQSEVRRRSGANPTQLRYINVLLSVSSRLGRALAELFGLLVKVCMGSSIRQRRGHSMPTVPPCFVETSREIARVLSFTLVDGLSVEKLPPSPFPKMKFTYLICSIGFTMPMLFDERRYAFHLMLQKFVQEGGLKAFFDVFTWALTSATPELPDSTVEFMNEWLTLLERLINPKAILHSPHGLPTRPHSSTRDPSDFDMLQYMMEVQRSAFHAIQQLRSVVANRHYSDRMHEYMLVILKHIFKAEAIIKERQTENRAAEEETEESDVASRVVVSRGRGISITRRNDQRTEAPVNPQHLRQLMDMGFSHDHCTAALRQATSVEQATDLLLSMPDRPTEARTMDVDIGEEEQYIHAILMSLRDMPDNLVEGSAIAEAPEVAKVEPLATEELDRFTDSAVYVCLHIIDTMPSLVTRALELLTTIAKRNGDKWRDEMLSVILDDVMSCLAYYEKHLNRTTPRLAFVNLMSDTALSERTNNRLHLLRLMLDGQQSHETRLPTANAILRANMLTRIYAVMERLDHRLTHFNTEVSGPKWFPHLAVLFNQMEQVTVWLERREAMLSTAPHTWRWYDVATAQWNNFSPANTRTIADAFAAGEASVRIRSGRSRLTINFGCMSQLNEETGAYQTVIVSPVTSTATPLAVPRGLDQLDVTMVLEILIDLLPLSVDVAVKLALMRVALRVTRTHAHAKYFAQHGGVEALLRMRHVPGQPSFLQMALLLIRHAIEEPRTLELAMEAVIGSRVVANVPAGYRDLIYLTRQISAAVARCPETYVKVAKRVLRLDPAGVRRAQQDDSEPRLLVKLATTPQQNASKNYAVEDKVTHDVINAILSALVTPDPDATSRRGSVDEDRVAPLADEEDGDSSTADERMPRARSPGWLSQVAAPSETADGDRPLLSKNVLLRFLNDLVRSYQTVALIVAEYSVEETPLIAYLIDTFIPGTESRRDRECNASARMLISSLAAMSSVGRIQSILIHEVKAALVRTWQMTDMAKKCVHIQLLAQLIPILIEGSPPEPPVVMTTSGLRQQLMMPRRNNMFYGMVRLNLIEDLARVTQQVDFANPHAIATLNAALKPLETLLRLTNQPTLSVVTRRRGATRRRTATRAAPPEESQQRNVDLIVETVMMSPENGERPAPAEAPPANTWEEGEASTWPDLYQLESSSDSEESESGGGEENAEPADMENEEEEEPEPEEAEPEEPSDIDVDEETRQFIEMYDQHVYGRRSPFGEAEREQDDVIMIQYPRGGGGDSVDAEAPESGAAETQRDSPRVYFHTMYEDGNETRTTAPREAPTTAAGNLQMLMGSSQSTPPEGNSVQRTNRMRRYQYLRSIAARNTTQPVILQRLLGPSQHTSTTATPFRDATRVVLMDNGFGIFSPRDTNGEEGAIDVIDRADYMFGRSLSASLSNTPPVLTAWGDESKLLGLETQSYVCMQACEDILRELEVLRAAEADKVAAKRKKAQPKAPPAANGVSEGGTEVATVPEIRVTTEQPEVILRTTTASLPHVAEEEAVEEQQDGIQVILMTRTTDDNEAERRFSAEEPRPASPSSDEEASDDALLNNSLQLMSPAQDDEDEEDEAEEEEAEEEAESEAEEEGQAGQNAASATESTPPPMEDAPQDDLSNVPAGIDPSFLAALPAEMRHEVIEEHLRVERNREEAQRNAAQQNHAIAEINSEFLAALPPNIQEEVLAQQRIDLRQQAAATANPNDPVDAAAFFQNLSPALRQSILSDMEDSQISVLPPELAAEAQNLRRDWQLMQEHVMNLLGGASSSSSSTVLRYRGRDAAPRSRLRGGWGGHLQSLGEQASGEGVVTILGQHSNTMDRPGNAFLDQEALTSLLVQLFIDAPKFNVMRFHRVVRNLCFHSPTRLWIIRALLAIMERTGERVALALRRPETRKRGPKCATKQERPTWLNIRLDPALGSRANVFIYSEATTRQRRLLLHPQAATYACRHALDLLTLLAKTFAVNFMPRSERPDEAGPSRAQPQDDFWDIVAKLDAPGGRVAPPEPQRRGARPKPTPIVFAEMDAYTLEEAPFGRLVAMLEAGNIRKSRPLTDKLLRLLAYVSIALPKEVKDTPPPPFVATYSERLLSTIVDVLSHKSCSEEGLDDVATLLSNLSQCSGAMRESIVQLLVEAVGELAQRLEEQIRRLIEELLETDLYPTSGDPSPDEPSRRGTLQDRFTREMVVVSSEGRPRPAGDLQLPSMAPLVVKASNQTFFLRTLKIIFQVRKVESEGGTPLGDALTLDTLWQALSDCLELLKQSHDQHAVLVFQAAVEAFFLTHAPSKRSEGGADAPLDVVSPMSPIAHDLELPRVRGEASPAASPGGHHGKFLKFAEKHRTVLNQILRQYTTHLADGPFAVLVDHTRILDFDVKRRYFRTELERCDEGIRREELAIHVNRMNVFEDSFRELYRRNPEEWKNRFYIAFEDEEGQDAGGLLREWYVIISREIFNPNYALFTVSPGDRVTYMINPSSHANSNHLCYYKFVGRVIAKAIYDNKLLECYFTRSLYKHILGIRVKYTDMESEDYDFYKGLVFLKENNITALGCELTFSLEVQEFGVTEVRDLIPNGRNIAVTEENKLEYIRLVCQLKMSGSIKQQLNAFLDGFYDIIPKRLIAIFNEQELELLISGLPNVDIEDLRANTEYHKYSPSSIQIQWFWRALRSFDQADRAKFLQFVTGTSKVPLQGFAALEGMNGIQKFQIHRDDRSTDRLPSAHTCFNQLDLPVYKTYDKLRECLQKAIHECSEGFGFA